VEFLLFEFATQPTELSEQVVFILIPVVAFEHFPITLVRVETKHLHPVYRERNCVLIRRELKQVFFVTRTRSLHVSKHCLVTLKVLIQQVELTGVPNVSVDYVGLDIDNLVEVDNSAQYVPRTERPPLVWHVVTLEPAINTEPCRSIALFFTPDALDWLSSVRVLRNKLRQRGFVD
jgi:hypothetical protein